MPSAAIGVVGSSSQLVSFTVDQAVSSTALTATGSKVKTNGGATTYQLRMTATVTLDTGSPAVGTVTFRAGGAVVGTAEVGSDGKASVTVPSTKGSVQVWAEFTPTDTANHLGSTSPTLSVSVK